MVVANVRVTSGGDEVQQAVNTVIPKPGVTLDTRLFGQNVIILAFKVTHDFLEAVMVSSGAGFEIVTEPTRIRCRCYRRNRACRRW